MSMEPIDSDKIEELTSRPAGNASLQEELARYRKSLEEEWKEKELADPENHAELVDKTRKQLINAIPIAVTNIVHLAEHADNENVRLKAQMYIIDNGLGQTGKFNPVDPLADLVKNLMPTTVTPTPPSDEGLAHDAE